MDGYVDIGDYIAINRVVLGLDLQYTNSLSVAGVTYNNVAIVYPTINDISAITSTYGISYTSVNELSFVTSNVSGIEFAAVSIGDLDGSCQAESQFKNGGGVTLSKALMLSPSKTALSPGEIFNVKIDMNDFDESALLSFRMLFGEGLEIIGTSSNKMLLENEDYVTKKNELSLISMPSIKNENPANNGVQFKEKAMIVTLRSSRYIKDISTAISLDDNSFDNTYTEFNNEGFSSSNIVLEFENSTAKKFEVSPNPFLNSLTISSSSESEIGEVVIYNNIGQQVFSKQLSSKIGVVENDALSNLPQGIYILSVEFNDGTVSTSRIIKN